MSTSPLPDGARAHLGSPTLPVNAPGAYLRHRSATERAYRERQRKLRLRRLALLIIAALLCLALGRDLVALALAGVNLASASARGSAQGTAAATQKLFQPAAARSLPSDSRQAPAGALTPASEGGTTW